VWAHHSGSVNGEVTVTSGRVFLNEANTEDVNTLLAGQPYLSSGATNVLYASFTVKSPRFPVVATLTSHISRIHPAVFERASGH
jgi:hypothetical protein